MKTKMKKEVRAKFYHSPPESIKKNINDRLFPGHSSSSVWKLALPAMAICLIVGVFIYRGFSLATIDETYVESYMLIEQVLDDGIEESISASEQEIEELDYELLDGLI